MTKVAVILSGCGHLDGAEIREAVLSLLYLDQHGAEVSVFAPDIAQHKVMNHLTRQPEEGQSRNVLVEAARIARGDIEDLARLDAARFDALVMPGGFGAALNLSNLAEKGAAADVIEPLKKAVQDFYRAKKPIGAICISPAVLTAALRDEGVTVTIGEDQGTAQAIERMGGIHRNCATDSFVFDEAHNVATCSAYMREDRLSAVAKGIEQVIAKVLEQAEGQRKAA